MNKRVLILLPFLFTIFLFACNKESTYTVKLHNISSGPVRVKVNYDQSLAAPGQNTLKMDKTLLQGQYLEVYYNKGLGISLPTMKGNDTLLQYEIKVLDDDSVLATRNYRSLNYYSATIDKKKKTYVYECKILDIDFIH